MSENFSEILNLSSKKNIPISVLIELTYRCNFKCNHCFYKNENLEKNELRVDEIFKLLEELKSSGTLFLTLSGGEILLRRDIKEIVLKAIELNFSTTLFTNGSLIDENFLKTFSKKISYEISLYPDEISKFRSGEILKKIEMMKKRNLNFTVKILLLNGFLDFYREKIKILKKMGIENINIDFVIYPKNSKDNGFKKLVPEISELRDFFKEFPEFLKPFKEEIQRNLNENMCSAGKRFCSIDPYGNVYPCPFLKLNCGNIKENSFMEIWENSPQFEEIRNLKIKNWEKCLSCNLNKVCRRCPSFSHIECGNIFKPSEINCFFAKIVSEI